MASNYPGSLDSFDTIASDKKTSDAVGGRTHRDMHNDLGDAIEAVQTELGTDPAGAYATVKARLAAWEAYAAKTSAYTATSADSTLNVTSGTFTLDLPAASSVTGKTLRIKNSGTGVVTLDGNSSETVEGVATFPLGPNSHVEITSTGAAWILTGGSPDTGWRNVSADLINSWAGSLYIRRVGNAVEWRVYSGDGSGASNDIAYAIPTGFKPASMRRFIAPSSSAAVTDVTTLITVQVDSTNGLYFTARARATGALRAGSTFTTTDAWPSSLPGSAA